MSNTINSLPSSLPVSSSTISSDSSVQDYSDVGDVSGAGALQESKSTSSAVAAQDAYGVVPVGTRGNVLSTQPPVPTDTASVSPTSLRSGQSKLAYLGESGTAGSQALALSAENPASNVTLPASSSKAATLGSASTSTSSASATTSSSSSGRYDENTTASSGTGAGQAEDSAAATKQADTWVKDLKNGKCNKSHHVDKSMEKATGLPKDVVAQAYALMKNGNTSDYNQQIATAMAVLAQEKSSGSSSYDADAAKLTTAFQTMTNNADTRGSGNTNSTASVKAFDTALASVSSVVTGQLGADPSGGAPKVDAFDPTNKVAIVNSWA